MGFRPFPEGVRPRQWRPPRKFSPEPQPLDYSATAQNPWEQGRTHTHTQIRNILPSPGRSPASEVARRWKRVEAVDTVMSLHDRVERTSRCYDCERTVNM